jgi:hypothetical protein
VKSYHTCVPVGRLDFFKRRTNIILGNESVKKKNELLRQVTELKDKEITFKQWKKVQDGEKYRHKEVQEVRQKAVFLTEFESELDQYDLRNDSRDEKRI